jgi:hypothetical protein
VEKCLQYMPRPCRHGYAFGHVAEMALILIGQDSKSPISKDWIGRGLSWLENG